MAILNPITSGRKRRDFAVLDLEWIPSTRLPLPANATVSFKGMRGTCKVPLPVKKRASDPLQVRIASFYDQPEVGEAEEGEEPVREERFLCYSSVRELIDFFLTYENRARWCYAHAGGLADMEFVLDDLFKEIKEELDTRPNRVTVTMATEEMKKSGIAKIEDYVKGQWKIRASFSGSSAIIIHISKGKNAWHFIDSYWLFRDKLASIGKAIGIKKGDTPEAKAWIKQRFGKNSLEELEETPADIEAFYRDAPLDVLVSYNRVDCEILWKAIAQFEDEIWELGGQLQQTIASTGMNLIRRAYLKRTIYTSDRINQIAEATYFSSRVEVTNRNIVDGIGYDINSSFPFSMTFPLPAGLTEVRTSLPDVDSDECIYLADVTMEVPDMPLPPLPYRVEGRVFFPIGRWRSWFTSTDIRLALKEGCTLHKVHEVYVFEPFLDIADFVRDIYGRRAATSDAFRKLLYKYLLNCMPGSTIVTDRHGRRIRFSDVKAGDKIIEDGREVDVLAQWSTGKKRILTLCLDNHTSVSCSPEHGLLRLNGDEVAAKDVRHGDRLFTPRSSELRMQMEPWRGVQANGVGVLSINEGPPEECYDITTNTGKFWLPDSNLVSHQCPYGKFAETPFKQEMLINPDKIDRATLQLLQPGVWLAEKKATVAHRHVPISTIITALSRRHLFEYGKMCLEQGKPSAYYDTDSLWTNADLPVDETKLGALKLEKRIDWAEFLAPKIYRGEGFELQKDGQWKAMQFTKAKGFSLGKARGEAWRRFDQIAGGDRIGIQRQVRMRELYRSNNTSPIDILVIKALTFEMLSKRFHYPDGHTRPWHIKELVSGDVYPKGFNFEPEILNQIDTTTRAMMDSVV
jgi:hypothetical protein